MPKTGINHDAYSLFELFRSLPALYKDKNSWSYKIIPLKEYYKQNSLQAQAPPPVAAQVSDTESDYGSVDSGAGVPRYNDRGQEEYRDLLIKTGVAIALVTYSRAGANHKEMSVTKGEYLEIMNMDRKWWKVRNKSQEVSFFLS